MAKEFDVLKEQANVIKNEVEDGANTASRVGGMFVDLVEKIQSLGATFAGVATPSTNPGTPDGPVFYIATTKGTYANFNGIVVQSGEAVILQYTDNTWVKMQSGFSTSSLVKNNKDSINNIGLSVIAGDVIEPDSSVASTFLDVNGNLEGNASYTIRKYNVKQGETFKVKGSTRGTKQVACLLIVTCSVPSDKDDMLLYNTVNTKDYIDNTRAKAITDNDAINKLIKEIYITGVNRGTVYIKNIHRQGGSTSDARGYILGRVGDTDYNFVLENTPRVPDGDNNIIKATAGSATIYFMIDWRMLDPGTGTNNNDFYELSDDAYTLSANPQIAEYLSAEFHSLAPEDLIEGKYVYQTNGSIYESSSYNIYVYPISANRRYRIKGELHGTTTFAIYSNYSDGQLSGLLYLFSKNENANIPIDEIIQGYNGYLAVSWNSLNVDVYTDGLDNIFSDIEDLQYRLASNAKLASVGSMQGYINENGGFVEHGSYTADSYTLVSGGKYRILGTYQGVKGVAALSFWSGSTFRKTIVDTNAITDVGSTISIDTYFTVPLGINKAYVTNTHGNTLFLYKVDKVDKVDNIGKQFNDVASLSVIAGDVIEPDSSVASTFLDVNGNLKGNASYTIRKYNVKQGETFKVKGSTRGTKQVACLLIVTCSVPSDKDDMLLYDLQNTKDYIDEVNSHAIKYVDCLGDSLTMGATRFGWYEDTLQELLGSGYKVRNWGVGGESSASIMARQGSDCIKFQEDWVLKADGSNTLVMNTEDNDLIIKTQTYSLNVALLLQGAENDSEQRVRVVNPCYIKGIECTMSYEQASAYGKGRWYIKRNEIGDRDITIPANTPVYFNTGKEMGKSDITIIWMGTNDDTYPNWQDLVDKQVMAANKVSNKSFIIIGLHKIGKTAGEAYEALMRNTFGNKFFNIREYMCTNMIYDAGMIPTEDDLAKMAAGNCPESLLYDGTHLKPASNVALGKMLYSICVGLGYIN